MRRKNVKKLILMRDKTSSYIINNFFEVIRYIKIEELRNWPL